MNEIQRMNNLKNHCNEQERKEIDGYLDVISLVFRRMIGATASYIIEGKTEEVTVNDGINALKAIGEIARRVNVFFPEIKDEQSARLYILTYGKDVIYS